MGPVRNEDNPPGVVNTLGLLESDCGRDVKRTVVCPYVGQMVP